MMAAQVQPRDGMSHQQLGVQQLSLHVLRQQVYSLMQNEEFCAGLSTSCRNNLGAGWEAKGLNQDLDIAMAQALLQHATMPIGCGLPDKNKINEGMCAGQKLAEPMTVGVTLGNGLSCAAPPTPVEALVHGGTLDQQPPSIEAQEPQKKPFSRAVRMRMRRQADQGYKVFVGGVPRSMEQDAVITVFAGMGAKVKKAWLQKHRSIGDMPAPKSASRHHRGFGFVVFNDTESLELVMGGCESRFLDLKGGLRLEVKRAVQSDQQKQGGHEDSDDSNNTSSQWSSASSNGARAANNAASAAGAWSAARALDGHAAGALDQQRGLLAPAAFTTAKGAPLHVGRQPVSTGPVDTAGWPYSCPQADLAAVVHKAPPLPPPAAAPAFGAYRQSLGESPWPADHAPESLPQEHSRTTAARGRRILSEVQATNERQFLQALKADQPCFVPPPGLGLPQHSESLASEGLTEDYYRRWQEHSWQQPASPPSRAFDLGILKNSEDIAMSMADMVLGLRP